MRPSRDETRHNCALVQRAIGESAPFCELTTDYVTADHAVAGDVAFVHLGVEWTKVGRDRIDWSGPQHRHQEWPAQMNRFYHLGSLASAWRQRRERVYAEAARDYVMDWIRAHPSREGWAPAPYDSTLNLCIRILEWFTALPVMLDSAAFDDAMVEAVLESARVQLNYLCEHLSSRMNWRIAQADSLLTSGLRLSGLQGADRWRRLGVHVLNDAFHRQVLPDGAHEERNPSYHEWMTSVFEKCWRLQGAMPALGLVIETGRIALMLDYSLGATRPNGALNAMHDCTGRRSGVEPNRALEARTAFRREAGLPDELPPTSQFFPCAGQAFLRDGWGPEATYVTFDATTWGGAHCHLSHNAIQLHAGGRSLIVDPGTLTYEASDSMGPYGKSTRAHSTLNLNGWNQSEADPVTRFESVRGYDLVGSRYEGGYWPGDYVWQFAPDHGRGLFASHHRTLLWVRGRFIAVLDQLRHDYADNAPFLESNWQFCEGGVEVDAEAGRVRTCNEDSNVLLLFPLRPAGSILQVHEGEEDPVRGWLPGEGCYVPAPQVSLLVAPVPAWWTELAAVLVPFRGAEPPKVAAAADSRKGVNRLLLRWGDGSSDELLWTGSLARAIDSADGLETDGGLVHLAKAEGERLLQGLVVDGTFLRPLAPDVRPAPCTFTLGPR